MRYLKEGPFNDHRKGADPKTIGEILVELAGNYIPIQGMALKTAEIRKLNKTIDVLEGGTESGYYAFEDEDFKVLKQVVITMAESTNMARSAPEIEDALNGATTEKPESNVVDIKEASGG